MLLVALSRLRRLWPDARIEVFTRVPERYPGFAPDVIPVPDSGRRAWFDQPLLNELLLGRLPASVLALLWRLDGSIKRRWPRLAIRLVRRGLRRRSEPVEEFEAFVESVRGADLVVASGMGGITDAFAYSAGEILDFLGLARAFGVPCALLSQGIGPVRGRGLRRRARRVLPSMDLIAVREGLEGPSLLADLGVSPDRVVVTGDDAIELAWERIPERLGDRIGINLRLAVYAGVDTEAVGHLTPILREACTRLGAQPVPVPISHVPGEEDLEAVRPLVPVGDRPEPRPVGREALDHTLALVGRCRVAVVGSYHAAVFALASGVPVIALENSVYYRYKFLGLADQFGRGCTVLSLTHSDLRRVLAEAIDHAWESAPSLREELIAAAARQVEAGRAAYRALTDLV